MFFGHFSLGLLFAALFPQIDINLLYIGSAWIDFFNGMFIITGVTITQSNPNSGPYLFQDLIYADWDHSLLMAFVWSVVFGLITATLFYSPKPKSKSDPPMSRTFFGTICFLTAFLHWMLDLSVHNSDLALYPGSELHLGWSWWGRFGAMSWVIEVAMTWAFIFIAALITRSQNTCNTTNNSYKASRTRVVTYHGIVIGVMLPAIINPILSPMKWSAEHPEFQSKFVDGLGVILGYVLPILLMSAIARYEDLDQTNSTPQSKDITTADKKRD